MDKIKDIKVKVIGGVELMAGAGPMTLAFIDAFSEVGAAASLEVTAYVGIRDDGKIILQMDLEKAGGLLATGFSPFLFQHIKDMADIAAAAHMERDEKGSYPALLSPALNPALELLWSPEVECGNVLAWLFGVPLETLEKLRGLTQPERLAHCRAEVAGIQEAWEDLYKRARARVELL